MNSFQRTCKPYRVTATVLAVLLLVLLSAPAALAAEYSIMDPFDLLVDSGKADGVVARAYTSNYENNVYVSMTDISRALNGTSKQFSIRFLKNESEGEHFLLTGGEGYVPQETAEQECTESVWLELKRNRILYNGGDRKYYTYRDAQNDLYMSLTDIQLMLDLTASFTSDKSILLEPDRPFTPDLRALNDSGYFNYLNGVVLGDATTGEVLFSRDPNKITAIASTSKLMTYLLLAEAAEAGRIRFEDSVTVSGNVEKLSRSLDGAIEMEEGEVVPVQELVAAMLMASSNEAALALAEYSYGSGEAFVAAMNQRARELGLNSAEFFNPHGLPQYERSTVQTKLQNRMSALDLFRLASVLVNRYPSVLNITSQQYVTLPTLEYTTANSNPLVFNLPGVNGLKTGSTNRAGYCLVASLPVDCSDGVHTVILALLGSENGAERGQQAEILLRSARELLSAQ